MDLEDLAHRNGAAADDLLADDGLVLRKQQLDELVIVGRDYRVPA